MKMQFANTILVRSPKLQGPQHTQDDAFRLQDELTMEVIPGTLSIIKDSSIFRNLPSHMAPFDTQYYRRAFPEGFQYSCCQSVSNSIGCQTGSHKQLPQGPRA